MIVMYGLFDLGDGVTQSGYGEAFEKFCRHLESKKMAVQWRFMRMQPHDGYNADAPETQFLVTVEFTDMAQAEACWTYVEQDEEPVRSLHRAINRVIENSRFFLCADVSSS